MCCSSHQEYVLKEHLRCSLVGADTSLCLTFVFVTVWRESKNKRTSLQCKGLGLTLVFMPILVVGVFQKKRDEADVCWCSSFIFKLLREFKSSYLYCYLCVQPISIILGEPHDFPYL